eukprot:GHVS01049508.1.p1 GENE.GHVS01049508.1~~GHVS01049508.1.p1  ORF type:complete len:286 (-),score=46.15 GHVS01049508.1:61-834(-)
MSNLHREVADDLVEYTFVLARQLLRRLQLAVTHNLQAISLLYRSLLLTIARALSPPSVSHNSPLLYSFVRSFPEELHSNLHTTIQNFQQQHEDNRTPSHDTTKATGHNMGAADEGTVGDVVTGTVPVVGARDDVRRQVNGKHDSGTISGSQVLWLQQQILPAIEAAQRISLHFDSSSSASKQDIKQQRTQPDVLEDMTVEEHMTRLQQLAGKLPPLDLMTGLKFRFAETPKSSAYFIPRVWRALAAVRCAVEGVEGG